MYSDLKQDRPLGSVEVNVSGLATTSDDPQYEYKSAGKKEIADKILVGRDQYKGVMHYTATFIPTMRVKGSNFKPATNELQRTAHRNDTDNVSISSGESLSTDDEYGARDITIRLSKTKENVLDDTPMRTSLESRVSADDKDEDEGIEMTRDELFTHRRCLIPVVSDLNLSCYRIWYYSFQRYFRHAAAKGTS